MPPLLMRVSDYIVYAAASFPTREALISAEHCVTYRELQENMDAIAAALIASGVRKGDRIATHAPPCPQFLELFLAAASIGAIWVGLNPKYSARELAHPIQDCAPSLIFTRREMDGRAYAEELQDIVVKASSDAEIICLPRKDSGEDAEWAAFLRRGEEIAKTQLDERRSGVIGEDVCLIVYTSGTTGTPKGAMLTHRGLIYCSHTDARYNLDSTGQRILCNFPINHIACVGDVCMTTLVIGGTIIFMETFDPRGVLETVERRGVTHLGQIPAMLQMELAVENFSAFDLGSLKQIIWGGNAASIDLVHRLRKICPNLANVYGMTETTGNILFARGEDLPDQVLASTVGREPPEYEVGVFVGDGKPAKIGEVGEIHARGPYLMKGYWDNEAATHAAFTADGWLRTGDLATRTPEGYISIVGRRSEMYKSGGYNIYPAEVEQVIEAHPGVAMAAVIGIPDPLYAEVGLAFIVSKADNLGSGAVREHCRTRLANYKIPKQFVFLDAMPMLANGKIDRLALKAQQLPE